MTKADATSPAGPELEQRGVPYVQGRHWISPFNFRPEVVQEYAFPKPLNLIDSTIRKVVYENPLSFFSQCARFEHVSREVAVTV